MGSLFPLVIIAGLAIIMFMGRRRQQKALAETREFQASLAVGERVMTTAGLYATVAELDEDTVELEVAPGVITTWSRMVIKERVVDTDELEEYDEFDEDFEDDDDEVGEDESEISMRELDLVKHDAKDA